MERIPRSCLSGQARLHAQAVARRALSMHEVCDMDLTKCTLEDFLAHSGACLFPP